MGTLPMQHCATTKKCIMFWLLHPAAMPINCFIDHVRSRETLNVELPWSSLPTNYRNENVPCKGICRLRRLALLGLIRLFTLDRQKSLQATHEASIWNYALFRRSFHWLSVMNTLVRCFFGAGLCIHVFGNSCLPEETKAC